MRCNNLRILAIGFLLASCAHDPVTNLDNSSTGSPGLKLEINLPQWPFAPIFSAPSTTSTPVEPSAPQAKSDQSSPTVQSVPPVQSAPSVQPVPSAQPVPPAQPAQRKPAYPAAALECQKYDTALIECFLELRESERDRDPKYEAHYKTCLKSHGFASKPDLCRNSVSPSAAARIISNGQYSQFPDFHLGAGGPNDRVVVSHYQ
jgi:hypothetical protein